ncbi:hypothetical protein THAOC_05511 [Thalassiosira oceanica]|uniref:2-C-methyl-D-erythritol 4-phosphate cytidylyltransferase, chloroplastic n=1 Tax=Thalassiosira oceanica TaxID=159749 RepID=K0TGW5_THAOC|nr:hypothetical protein THAOC_05511 [Thalassiosira oceanica]|eukprot:EJK72911.1 hypothetical protein THAOC_05511 [Thalassiosira oceanica]
MATMHSTHKRIRQGAARSIGAIYLDLTKMQRLSHLLLVFLLPCVTSFVATTNSNFGPSTSKLTSNLHAYKIDNGEPFQGFGNTGFLILAGGTGSRMKASMPKQFLELQSAPILHYSLHLFLEKLPAYCEASGLTSPPQVVLVLDPKYQPEYQPIVDKYEGRLAFANPGVERQGSVENGLNKLVELSDGACEYIAVHDSARPLVTIEEICNVVSDAHNVGAAVLGVPCKATIKESDDGVTVQRTIPRARLWEVHTPQVVKVEALLHGFDKVAKEDLEVTDDVSIIEALGEPVKLTRGEYTNLKITTPEDMDVAGAILSDRGEEAINLLGSTSTDGNVAVTDQPDPIGTFQSPFGGQRTIVNFGSGRLSDGKVDDNVRAYPARPTPSKWHE